MSYDIANFVITVKGIPYPMDFYDLESEEWKVRQSAYRTDVQLTGKVSVVKGMSMITVIRQRLEHVPSVHMEAEMQPIRPKRRGCVVS